MKRLYNWALSHPRWLVLGLCATFPALLLGIWLLGRAQIRTIVTWIFIVIWFIHFILGIGAGYAALRLWYARHQPLIARLGLYINAFIIDVLSAVVLVFMARGVTLTWKFSTVMFVATFLGDLARMPLIFYLIRGPSPVPLATPDPKASGALPPQFWLDAFRQIVREEVAHNETRRQESTPG